MKNNDIVIKVEDVSKKYLIGENSNYPTLRDKLMELPRRIFQGPKKNQEYWALKNISFEIKRGEVVGIIGRNGAGKSTLLKILARITEPTNGKVTMYGRVASMLEVGTGFNPELTGRENIYLNGAIIGMKKSEIKKKFDEIVAFSGVEKFLDTPVKHYSSGMYVRLAFAVAAHLDADILLVDEVLAVGDADFQKKCLGKMSDLASSGRTVIFVSHNSKAIQTLCSTVIFLENNKIRATGSTEEIMSIYESGIKNTPNKLLYKVSKRKLINSSITLRSIQIVNAGQLPLTVDNEIVLKLQYTVKHRVKRLGFTLILKDHDTGDIIFSSISNTEEKWYKKTVDIGKYITICHIPKHLLNDKIYQLDICTFHDNYTEFTRLENAIIIKINDDSALRADYTGQYAGYFRPYLEWKTEKQ